MKKMICILITLIVFISIIPPALISGDFVVDPEAIPVKSWNEFEEKYTTVYGDFPFADFGRLNEITSIRGVTAPKRVHRQLYFRNGDDVATIEIAFFDPNTYELLEIFDIYLLDEEEKDKHPAQLHFYFDEEMSWSDTDLFDYSETSQPIHLGLDDHPSNSQFITYCNPEYFIANMGATYKYQKEGIDIYIDYSGMCYFKIDNYLFEINLHKTSSPYLFTHNDEYTIHSFVTEEEYIAAKPEFGLRKFEYELGYIWNDKSELVSLLKEIVAGIPAAPDESSQPDESSDATSDTVSNETTEPTVSDEPNESVSENSETSIAEPKGSENTVWIVIIGVATVALVVAAAVIITKKKK